MVKKKRRIEMDSNFFRERQHQQVEVIRQQNFRDQHQLSEVLYSRRSGMVAKRDQEIREVSKEQQKIWQELKVIHQSTTGRLADIEDPSEETFSNSPVTNLFDHHATQSVSSDTAEQQTEEDDDKLQLMQLASGAWSNKRAKQDKNKLPKRPKRKNILAASLQLRAREKPHNRKLPSLDSIFFRKEKEKAKSKIKAEHNKSETFLQKFFETFHENFLDDLMIDKPPGGPDLRDSEVIHSAPAQLQDSHLITNQSYLANKGLVTLPAIDLDKARDSVQKRFGELDGNSGNRITENLTQTQSKTPEQTKPKHLSPMLRMKGLVSKAVGFEDRSSTYNPDSQIPTRIKSNKNIPGGAIQKQIKGGKKIPGHPGNLDGSDKEDKTKSSHTDDTSGSGVKSKTAAGKLGSMKSKTVNNPDRRKQSLSNQNTPNASDTSNSSNKTNPILIRHVIKKEPIVASKPILPAIRESSQMSAAASVRMRNSVDHSENSTSVNTSSVPQINVEDHNTNQDDTNAPKDTNRKGSIKNSVGVDDDRRSSSENPHFDPDIEKVNGHQTLAHIDENLEITGVDGATDILDGNIHDEESLNSNNNVDLSSSKKNQKNNVIDKRPKRVQLKQSSKIQNQEKTDLTKTDDAPQKSKEQAEDPYLPKKKKKGKNEPKVLNYDPKTHNPDGSLRTLYDLPDFQESLNDAMKSRYLRLKYKQWFERDMSSSDVFKDLKENKKEQENNDNDNNNEQLQA